MTTGFVANVGKLRLPPPGFKKILMQVNSGWLLKSVCVVYMVYLRCGTTILQALLECAETKIVTQNLIEILGPFLLVLFKLFLLSSFFIHTSFGA